MLRPDEIEALRDRAESVTDRLTEFLLRDITRRIVTAAGMTSTAAYQIFLAELLGTGLKTVHKELQKRTGHLSRAVRKLLKQAAAASYRDDIRRLSAGMPFEENETVQQIIGAEAKMAEASFRNLTGTLGFVNPGGKVSKLTDAYRECCDFAFQQTAFGTADMNTAVRQATKNLADKGVRVIDYESGVHTSVEAAVRRNVMGGLGQMQEQISQQNHDDMGANGWEISAHGASAPDHEPIQGRQYTDDAYQKLNASLVRRIGTLNCGHTAFPIVLGISRPQYTDAQLEQMRQDNETGVTVNGRHYTTYEATQQQRAMERAMRRQKRRIVVDEAAGDDDKLLTDQIRLGQQNAQYRQFSRAAGLRTQDERANVAEFTAKQANSANKTIAKYEKVRYNKDGTIVVTDDWCDRGKVPIPRNFRPNAVLQTKTTFKNGTYQIDRTIYDENGVMKTQIHPGAHNRSDLHKMGKNGEHAHDYTWTSDGKSAGRTNRDLTDAERLAHADLLKGGLHEQRRD